MSPFNGLRRSRTQVCAGLGIDLERAAQIVESPQTVALLDEYGAQVLEGHRVPGIGGKSFAGTVVGEVAQDLAPISPKSIAGMIFSATCTHITATHQEPFYIITCQV
ncbi:MAG: hypothetical protein QG575_1066 [Euryarchaeota archaeon]|nr:hypothetical protein [Euryarchaeota archaeon]